MSVAPSFTIKRLLYASIFICSLFCMIICAICLITAGLLRPNMSDKLSRQKDLYYLAALYKKDSKAAFLNDSMMLVRNF